MRTMFMPDRTRSMEAAKVSSCGLEKGATKYPLETDHYWQQLYHL